MGNLRVNGSSSGYTEIDGGTTGGATISSTSSSNVPLTVKGASSQTANLIEFKNSSGTTLGGVGTDGKLVTPGSVVQVQYSSSTTATGINSTSWTQVGGSDLTINIVPSRASNKILITVSISAYTPNATNGYIGLFRGGGAVNLATEGYYAYQAGEFSHQTFSYLDSPNTTSSTLYSVYGRNGTGTALWTVNYSDGGGACRSTITAMEIVA